MRYLVWYRGMAAVPESANHIGESCKLKQNLNMLQGQGRRARIVKLHWKSLQMKQKGDCRTNGFVLQSPFSAAGAPWRAPERGPARLGARGAPPRENVEKAWKFMHFPAWRPGRLQGASLRARARPGAPRGSGKTWKSEKTRILP